MKENTREAKLKILFATHPEVDKFYLTSDDKAFFDEHRANAHAQRLKDQDVESYSRKLVDALDQLLNIEGDDIINDDPEGGEGDISQEALKDEEANKEASEEEKEIDGSSQPDEREALVAAYAEKYGKKPAHNIGIEKLMLALAEEKPAAE
jgi:hypothetical protein